MKIISLPTIGLLSFALAGCIGRGHDHDHDHSSSVMASSESSVVMSSSSDIPPSSSSVSSSSAPDVVISSSSVVSSSSISSVMSSSSMMSSSVASSSSVPMVNIEDLTFTAELKEDKSIATDSIADLGSVFMGLIDKDAFDEFYLSLVAQGLDQAAIAKAASVMAPIGTAIGADFVERLGGAAVAGLIQKPEGVNLIAFVSTSGEFDEIVDFNYAVNQEIDGVAVELSLSLHFEETRPNLAALLDGRNGYVITLDGLQVLVNELKLTTNDVTIAIDTTNPVVFSAPKLSADAVLTADSSGLLEVSVLGRSGLSLNVNGSVVNGIIGATASATGTINILRAAIDLVGGDSSVELRAPDITVQMQGVDTSN